MEKFAPLNMSPEELIEYTPEWEGERFADGRPKVPDDILERMRNVSITQAWGVIGGPGYNWQYEDGWICTHPGQVLVGRALTAMYMPRRPVMRRVMEEKGERAGCIGDQISWPIDMLVPGDVYVADVFGKIDQGAVIGDNLATAIYANSGNGVVHDASVRDIDGIQELPDFTSFVRGFHPTFASPTIMLSWRQLPSAHRRCHGHARRRSARPRRWRRLHTASPSRTGGQNLRVNLAPRPLWQTAPSRGQIHTRPDRYPLVRPH